MDTLETLTAEIVKLADDNVRQAVGNILVQVGKDLSDLGAKYLATPKRRGRKPKAEDPAEEQPKKRRGRKPKAEAPAEEQPKKRRGRKPKVQAEESAAAEPEVKVAGRKRRTRQSKSVYEMMEQDNA
jgi:hypothetical protein